MSRTAAAARVSPGSGAVDPPGSSGEEGRGGGDGWTLLTTASNQVVACLIQGRLASQGIDSSLDPSNPAPGAWLHPFGDQQAPVRVWVQRRNLSEAAMILHEVGHEPPNPEAPGPASLKVAFWFLLAMALILGAMQVVGVGPCALRVIC